MSQTDLLKPLNILLMSAPELTGAGIDPTAFTQAVANLPHCRVLSMDTTQPEADQQKQVRTFLGEERHPVLLVAKDPEYKGAGVAQLLQGELKLNPEYLLHVDLTAALEHPEPDRRTAKSLEIIRQAASQASLAQPITTQTLPVCRQVLIWGDSGAALQAAWELAQLGYPVLLASPHSQISPLPWETAAPSGGLAPLIQQVLEHPGIKTLVSARLEDFEGTAGRFTVRLGTPETCQKEQVGAVILAPELDWPEDLSAYQIPAHPGVLSLGRLEGQLAEGVPGPERVAILLGLGQESHPLALERALLAASRLLGEGSQVSLLISTAKVAGPDLQRLLREMQDAGLIMFKLNEAPQVAVQDEGLRLTFLEPTVREELSLGVDLLVYDEPYQAAPENAALATVLRLPLGPGGFLQSGNVHHVPVTTPRRGIVVLGPGRGIMGPEETKTDINAAVNEIRDLLGQGEAAALQGRSYVDRGKCVFCLTCYRFCPHGAITWDNRAIINELACQGCGICASQCPNDAIQIRNCSDGQVEALLETFDPDIKPRIVAFMCRNSGWEAYQAALKLHAASLPLGFSPIKLPCAGKVDADYLLKAFNAGADGVMVLSCPPDNCKSTHGNLCAEWSVEQVQAMLAEAGIAPRRLQFHSLAANAPGEFIQAVDGMMSNLRRLSQPADEAFPVWLSTGTIYREHRTVTKTYTYTYTAQYHTEPEVLIEINPQDARNLGIRSGEQFQTKSRDGVITATAVVTDRVSPGTAFLPRPFLDNARNLLLQEGAALAGSLQSSEGLAVQLEKVMERFEEVFGIKVSTSRFLHRGHTWVARESGGRVRIGMDDFSQKLLGASDAIRLPNIGQEIRRDRVGLALGRQGAQAGVLAPVVGIIEEVNPRVLKRPGLTHDDPYGEGWMIMVAPTNLKPDLDNLISGEECAAWMEEETSRLLTMLDPAVGATLQAGGSLIDDVYGQCPELGWDRLVKEFLRSA